MNCTQIEQYLDAMMDGALSAEELNAVEAHCRGCAACAENTRRRVNSAHHRTSLAVPAPVMQFMFLRLSWI